eukprot:3060546-Prymnesium_polylepis.1
MAMMCSCTHKRLPSIRTVRGHTRATGWGWGLQWVLGLLIIRARLSRANAACCGARLMSLYHPVAPTCSLAPPAAGLGVRC